MIGSGRFHRHQKAKLIGELVDTVNIFLYRFVFYHSTKTAQKWPMIGPSSIQLKKIKLQSCKINWLKVLYHSISSLSKFNRTNTVLSKAQSTKKEVTSCSRWRLQKSIWVERLKLGVRKMVWRRYKVKLFYAVKICLMILKYFLDRYASGTMEDWLGGI
jgi:hypothetical protein